MTQHKRNINRALIVTKDVYMVSNHEIEPVTGFLKVSSKSSPASVAGAIAGVTWVAKKAFKWFKSMAG